MHTKTPVHHTLITLLARYSRVLRFGLVGASGALLNTVILWLLTRFGQLPLLVASAIATELSILSNFWLNDRWTFRTAIHRYGLVGRLLRYNGIALGGLLITVGLLALLMHFAHLALVLANLLAIVGALAWNYLINARWTWQQHPAPMTTQTTRSL